MMADSTSTALMTVKEARAWLQDTARPELEKYRADPDVDVGRMLNLVLFRCTNDQKLRPLLQSREGLTSLADACIECLQMGLEPTGAIGGAHLVAFKGRAAVLWSYEGLQDLAYRTGRVRAIWAEVVYENDHFRYELGLRRDLVHQRHPSGEPHGQVVASYAVADLVDRDRPEFCVMLRQDLEERRRLNVRQGEEPSGSWLNYAKMARIKALRELCWQLPRSIRRLHQALAGEHTWGPPDDEPPPDRVYRVDRPGETKVPGETWCEADVEELVRPPVEDEVDPLPPPTPEEVEQPDGYPGNSPAGPFDASDEDELPAPGFAGEGEPVAWLDVPMVDRIRQAPAAFLAQDLAPVVRILFEEVEDPGLVRLLRRLEAEGEARPQVLACCRYVLQRTLHGQTDLQNTTWDPLHTASEQPFPASQPTADRFGGAPYPPCPSCCTDEHVQICRKASRRGNLECQAHHHPASQPYRFFRASPEQISYLAAIEEEVDALDEYDPLPPGQSRTAMYLRAKGRLRLGDPKLPGTWSQDMVHAAVDLARQVLVAPDLISLADASSEEGHEHAGEEDESKAELPTG